MNRNFFYSTFKDDFSMSHETSVYLSLMVNLILILIIGYLLFKTLRFFSRKFLHRIASKTRTSFDDLLIKNKVFLNIARIVMLLIFSISLEILFEYFPRVLKYAEKFTAVVIAFFIIWFIRSVLRTIKDYLREFSSFKDKPLESYIQIFMVVLWMVGIIVSFSILTGKSLLGLFTVLGAFSAVLLLIFKDTILGFVASIQISINDTVRLNDWITMEKFGADGNVIAINLASVIVKNFDNTVTSIPTYSLISDSFKNWRAMNNSGGRRIKRSILIKGNSVRFLTEEEIQNFKNITVLKDYIMRVTEEISSFNTANKVDKTLLINGRNLTNLGLFRKYIDLYLQQHPDINQNLLVMTRQLDPTPNGIPLEIYAFSKIKVWEHYERIISDIFDHILASTSYFNLEIFENPSSKDVSRLQK